MVLASRELEVLELMANGCSNAGIASRLYLSDKTVEWYVHRIFEVLAVPADPATTGVSVPFSPTSRCRATTARRPPRGGTRSTSRVFTDCRGSPTLARVILVTDVTSPYAGFGEGVKACGSRLKAFVA